MMYLFILLLNALMNAIKEKERAEKEARKARKKGKKGVKNMPKRKNEKVYDSFDQLNYYKLAEEEIEIYRKMLEVFNEIIAITRKPIPKKKPRLPKTPKGWRKRAIKLAYELAPVKTIEKIILTQIAKAIVILNKKVQKSQQVRKQVYVLKFGNYQLQIPQIRGIDLLYIINNLKKKYYEFAPLLDAVEFVENPSIDTAMTDGWRIYYNPEFISSQDETFAEIIILHELLHIIRKDIQTMKKFSLVPMLWNLATDKIINQEIIDEYNGDKIPLFTQIHKTNVAYIEELIQKSIANMDEFEIYSELQNKQQDQENNNQNNQCDNNCNNRNNNNNNNNNNKQNQNDNNGDNKDNNNNNKENNKQNENNNSNSNNKQDNKQNNERNNNNGNKQNKFKSLDELKVNEDELKVNEDESETEKEYKRKLEEAIKEYYRMKPQEQAKRKGTGNEIEKMILNKVQEKIKVNLRKIGKEIEKKSLYENPIKRKVSGIIEFSTKYEKPDVIVVLDVSGSMIAPIKYNLSALDLAQVIIKEIDKQFNIVKIFTGNTELVEVRKTINFKELNAGGGTNMKQVLKQIEEQKKIKEQIIILITDADDDLQNIQSNNNVYGVFITNQEQDTNIPYTRVFLEFLDIQKLSKSMKIIELKDLKRLIKLCIQYQITPIIWGYYGIGKTQIVRQIAEEIGYELIEVNVPEMIEEDIKGVRVYSEKRDEIIAKVHGALSEINPDKKTLIYLDEVNRTRNRDILNSLLKIILDKTLPFMKLTPQQKQNITFILTANPEDESVYELDAALLNRMAQVFLMPTLEIANDETWVEYISNKYKIKPDILRKLLKGVVLIFDDQFKVNTTPRNLEKVIQIIVENNFKLDQDHKDLIEMTINISSAKIILNNLTKIIDNLEDLVDKMKQKFYNENFNFNQLSLQEKRVLVDVIQNEITSITETNLEKFKEIIVRLYDLIQFAPENNILLHQALIPIFDKVVEVKEKYYKTYKPTFKMQEVYRRLKETKEGLHYYIAIDKVINNNKIKWYIDEFKEVNEIIEYLKENEIIFYEDEEDEERIYKIWPNYIDGMINEIFDLVYQLTTFMVDGEIIIEFQNKIIPNNINILRTQSYSIDFECGCNYYTFKIYLYNPYGIKTIVEILQKFTTTNLEFGKFIDALEVEILKSRNKSIEEYLLDNEFIAQGTTKEIDKVYVKYNNPKITIEVHINNTIYAKEIQELPKAFYYNISYLKNNTLYIKETFNTFEELTKYLDELEDTIQDEEIAQIIKLFENISTEFMVDIKKRFNEEIVIKVEKQKIIIKAPINLIILELPERNTKITDARILALAGKYNSLQEIEEKLNKINNNKDIELDMDYIDKSCLEFLIIDTKTLETLTTIYWEVSDEEYNKIKAKIKKNYNETDNYLRELGEKVKRILAEIALLTYQGKIEITQTQIQKRSKRRIQIIENKDNETKFKLNIFGYSFEVLVYDPYSIRVVVQVLNKFNKTTYEDEEKFLYDFVDEIRNMIEKTIPNILQNMGYTKTQIKTSYGKIICKYHYTKQKTEIEVHWGNIYIKERKGIYMLSTQLYIENGILFNKDKFYNINDLNEILTLLENRIQDKDEIELVNETLKIAEFIGGKLRVYFNKNYVDIYKNLIITIGEFTIMITKYEFRVFIYPEDNKIFKNTKTLILAGEYNNIKELEERMNKIQNNEDIEININYINNKNYLSFMILREKINQAEIKWYLSDNDKEELKEYFQNKGESINLDDEIDAELYLNEIIESVKEFLEIITHIVEGASIDLVFYNEKQKQNIEIFKCYDDKIVFKVRIYDYVFRIEILSIEAKRLEKILKKFTKTKFKYGQFLEKLNKEVEKVRNNKITTMFEGFEIIQNDNYETKVEAIYNVNTNQTTIKAYVLNVIYTKTIQGLSKIFSREGWYCVNEIHYRHNYEILLELNDILYYDLMEIERNQGINQIINLFKEISEGRIITSFNYEIYTATNNEINIYIDLEKDDIIGDEVKVFIKHSYYNIKLDFEKYLLNTEALLLAGKYNTIEEIFERIKQIKTNPDDMMIEVDYINKELLV